MYGSWRNARKTSEGHTGATVTVKDQGSCFCGNPVVTSKLCYLPVPKLLHWENEGRNKACTLSEINQGLNKIVNIMCLVWVSLSTWGKNVCSLFYNSGTGHECLGFICFCACLSGTWARPSPIFLQLDFLLQIWILLACSRERIFPLPQ